LRLGQLADTTPNRRWPIVPPSPMGDHQYALSRNLFKADVAAREGYRNSLGRGSNNQDNTLKFHQRCTLMNLICSNALTPAHHLAWVCSSPVARTPGKNDLGKLERALKGPRWAVLLYNKLASCESWSHVTMVGIPSRYGHVRTSHV
jgi:hypothetical protein